MCRLEELANRFKVASTSPAEAIATPMTRDR
jgi:hypothetical protein